MLCIQQYFYEWQVNQSASYCNIRGYLPIAEMTLLRTVYSVALCFISSVWYGQDVRTPTWLMFLRQRRGSLCARGLCLVYSTLVGQKYLLLTCLSSPDCQAISCDPPLYCAIQLQATFPKWYMVARVHERIQTSCCLRSQPRPRRLGLVWGEVYIYIYLFKHVSVYDPFFIHWSSINDNLNVRKYPARSFVFHRERACIRFI